MIFWIKDIAYHKERYSRQTEVMNVRVSRRKARETDAREKSGIRGETTVDGVFVATRIHNFVA